MRLLVLLLAGVVTTSFAAFERSSLPHIPPTGFPFSVPEDSREKVQRYLAMVKPKKRHAFVIGISRYDNADNLPSAKQDAVSIHALLRDQLGFSVNDQPLLDARNINQIWTLFNAFLERIKPGDIALVYFSGHGFSYKDNAYLVPGGFSPCVLDEDVPFTFLSESNIREALARKSPAVAMTIFDACRTLQGPVVGTLVNVEQACANQPSGEKAIFTRKGVARLKDGHVNWEASGLPEPTTITEWDGYSFYASEKGSPAIAISDSNQLSYFTEALHRNLSHPGLNVFDLYKEVRYEVCRKTKTTGAEGQEICRQKAALYPSSHKMLWLHEDESSLRRQQESFVNAIIKDTREVEKFTEFFGASAYASAANQYLKDHPPGERSYTWLARSYSATECRALGIEVPENARCSPVLDADLAFSRSRTLPTQTLTPALGEDGLKGVTPGRFPASALALALENHVNAVARVDKRLVLRAPVESARSSGELRWHDSVEVLETVVKPGGGVYSKIRVSSSGVEGYLRQRSVPIKAAFSVTPVGQFTLEFSAIDKETRLDEADLIKRLEAFQPSANSSVVLKIEMPEQLESLQRIRMSQRLTDAYRIALLAGYQRGEITTDKRADFTELRIRFSISHVSKVPVVTGKRP